MFLNWFKSLYCIYYISIAPSPSFKYEKYSIILNSNKFNIDFKKLYSSIEPQEEGDSCTSSFVNVYHRLDETLSRTKRTHEMLLQDFPVNVDCFCPFNKHSCCIATSRVFLYLLSAENSVSVPVFIPVTMEELATSDVRDKSKKKKETKM